MRVYDSAGVAQTLIEADDAFGYVRGASHSDLAFQQVADTLYVTNKTTEVVAAPGTDYASWRQDGDLGVFIQQTAYEHLYTLGYNGTSVGITTQDVSDIIGSRPYSGAPGNIYAQPYRVSAGQAAGDDPIMLLDLNVEMRVNTIGDLDIRTIADTQFQFNTTLPAGQFGAPQIRSTDAAPPASGQPTNWLSDYSDGVGIGPVQGVVPAALDPHFQAIWLQPNELSAGDWIGIGRAQVTNTTQVSPQYLARELAVAYSVLSGSTVEPAFMLTPTKDPDELDASAFLIRPEEPVNVDPTMVVTNTGTGTDNLEWGEFVQDSVVEIPDLPVVYKQGAVVEITGSVSSDEDNYFVQFVTDEWREAGSDEETIGTFPADLWGRGGWRETAEPGLPTGGYDATTMPHRLERAADGTWTFRSVGWGKRPSGDNLTNPEPSFVGGRIFDVFYHEDRLGFLSGSSLILSESGEIENFWRTTVLALPDSDPIDITLSAMQGSALYHAVSFDRALHVFSEDSQAVLSSEGALSPVTVSAKITGTYRTSPTVPPATQESSLFAAYRTGSFMQVREMMPGQYAGDLISGEVTLAVPRLLPSSVRKVLTGGGGSDLVYLTDDGQVFLYQYLRAGRENIMAAWGRWNFPDGALVDAVRMGDHIYALINRVGLSATYTCLEKIEVGAGRGDTTVDYKIRSDRLTSQGLRDLRQGHRYHHVHRGVPSGLWGLSASHSRQRRGPGVRLAPDHRDILARRGLCDGLRGLRGPTGAHRYLLRRHDHDVPPCGSSPLPARRCDLRGGR